MPLKGQRFETIEAIGRCAIQQGHRVVYCEAPALIGKPRQRSTVIRKETMAELAAAPLLIIDDPGCAKAAAQIGRI